MKKLLRLRFVENERGCGTVFGLLWFMILVGITGLTVDSTDSFRTKTGLQAAADAASLAASIDLPDEAMALDAALLYAELNMLAAVDGTVLRPEDVQFGAAAGRVREL
jgi:Flp pilus assembly protein TadG